MLIYNSKLRSFVFFCLALTSLTTSSKVLPKKHNLKSKADGSSPFYVQDERYSGVAGMPKSASVQDERYPNNAGSIY